METMAGYTIGMPDYKEPEIKIEESQEDILVEKSGPRQERSETKIKSNPKTKNFETEVQKEDEPFKISLLPVGDRTKVKQKTKVEVAAEKPNKIEPKHADGVMKHINHSAWKTNIENSETNDENKMITLNCNKLNNAKTKYQHQV